MRSKHLLSFCVIVVGLFLFASSAHAGQVTTTTYYFNGVCSDCNGHATASLVLDSDYVPGSDLQDSFVSFTYNGTNLFDSYTITASDPGLVALGYMRGDEDGNGTFVSGTGTLTVRNEVYYFESSVRGGWSTGFVSDLPADYGDTHAWALSPTAATPEPGTMALLGTGIATLATMRRRFVRR